MQAAQQRLGIILKDAEENRGTDENWKRKFRQ